MNQEDSRDDKKVAKQTMAPLQTKGCSLDLDLHTRTQIKLLPTSSERLSISSALLFTKDQTQREIIVVRLKGNQAVNKSGVNYGGNMDRGAMTFTSDVSLPKDSKQLCWVNKLQLGN